MKILYGYSNCSQKKYDELMKDADIMILQQDQKYHSLLTIGMAECGAELTCVSGLPVNRSVKTKTYIKKETEFSDGINYIYFGTFNLPILRQISILINSYKYTKKYLKANPDSAVVTDILFSANSFGMMLAAKKFKNKKFGIVTDIPESFNKKKGIAYKMLNFVLKNLDGYLFLTKYMTEAINKENKPYVVIEGQADSKMKSVDNVFEEKYDKRVVFYAGLLHKRYGIKNLTEAFIKADVKGCELHIYGDGDYKEELICLTKKYENIKYFGVKPNSYVVNEELKATLLVNPRPANQEFTKYSFPSKTMEYMVSGTPLLSTKLDGIPNEYFEHIYTIDDDGVEGISKKLSEILNRPKTELYSFGKEAKQFIIKEKNNIVQGKKFVDFITRISK